MLRFAGLKGLLSMRYSFGLFVGVITTLSLVGVVAYSAITNGWLPVRCDEPSSQFETWAAHQALHAALNREAPKQSPIPADESNLMAGCKLYADNCSGCHGAPKNPTPAYAKGYSPEPTLFGAGDLVADDPEGFTWFKIKHGIRFTGMPAFTGQLKDNEIWQLSLFLKHMDKLPPKVEVAWKQMR
jgi:mono/diheme cytochrome c family protein